MDEYSTYSCSASWCLLSSLPLGGVLLEVKSCVFGTAGDPMDVEGRRVMGKTLEIQKERVTET